MSSSCKSLYPWRYHKNLEEAVCELKDEHFKELFEGRSFVAQA